MRHLDNPADVPVGDRRDKFGAVGPFTLNNGLTENDLDNLVFPRRHEARKG